METMPGQKYPHLIDIRDQAQDFEVPPEETVTVISATKTMASHGQLPPASAASSTRLPSKLKYLSALQVEMLKSNQVNSLDQQAFQQQFEDFEEDLEKRKSDSSMTEALGLNSLALSRNAGNDSEAQQSMAILSTFEPKSSSVGVLAVPDIDEIDKHSENADDTMETQQ